MIRKLQNGDINKVADLWLKTNLEAHDFIPGQYWTGKMQSHGIGKALLDYIKDKKGRLQLNVYQKNVRAMSFYQREGFTIQREQLDEFTSEKEYIMEWSS